jgi:hypothetical protein
MARKKPKRWVEVGPMMPWMRAYARWLAGSPTAEMAGTKEDHRSRYPMLEVRAARASEYAGRPVQTQLITLLEKRKDLREYFEKIREDVDYHTKELAKQEVAENFEIRRAGLHKAAGRVEVDGVVTYDVQDLKAIEHYTRPFIERGIGKKVDHERESAPRVVINLIGARPEDKRLVLQALADETPEDVDYEVIANPKLLGDGEDE